MSGLGATGSIIENEQQRQFYSWGRPVPICRRFHLPQNCESGQYWYFLTQHQATSAEWRSNTRPDCGLWKNIWTKSICGPKISNWLLKPKKKHDSKLYRQISISHKTSTKVTKYWHCKADTNSWDYFCRQAFLRWKLWQHCKKGKCKN